MIPLRPPRLRRGDTIGIVSPSWGGAGEFPHRLGRGVAQLHAMGFETRIGAHARNSNGFISDSPENRAADIHTFFLDPSVRMILATIGGDHSCHLLPHLDYELIARHPTIVMGFSDVTVLNVALWAQCGLVTFNGPALLTDFAEYPEMLAYTRDSFSRIVESPEPAGELRPATSWTEEFLDWATKDDLTRPRKMTSSTGWRWLKPGRGQGQLVGGCLESLQHLRGTPYWPSWDDTILFFETSEEAPSPAKVDGILMDYENMGVLGKLSGMLVGRPMRYSEEEKLELDQVLLERTSRYDFPIVTNMDFGHTAPLLTLPIGCTARIDSSPGSVTMLDGAVE